MTARTAALLAAFAPDAYLWPGDAGCYFEVRTPDPEGETLVHGWGSTEEEAVADAFHRNGRAVPADAAQGVLFS